MIISSERILDRFELRASERRACLIPYLTAGFPNASVSAEALDVIAEAGADVIEWGIPFSDPLADGPTIQKSSFDALAAGASVERALELVADFRRSRGTPVVVFSYLNPILRYGFPEFLAAAAEVGVQGLLLTDLPSGADPDLEDRVLESELDLIRLLAPTTPAERVAQVASGGQGFLYYISRTGVTGASSELRPALGEEVHRIRASVDLPVAVGFGISSAEQAAAVAAVADGVVVGSALVRVLGESGPRAAGEFLGELRVGMDRGPDGVA